MTSTRTMPPPPATILTLAVALLHPCAAPAETWPFTPRERDPFTAGALLDLRALNEKQSGGTGFVRLSADGNSFVRGDGEPIRFWATNTEGWTLSPEDADRQCRWLAKMGVNLIRLHFTIAAPAPEKTRKAGEAEAGAQPIEALNEKIAAGVYRCIKAAKANGIYLCISPYWAHHGMPATWEIEGFAPGQKLQGALFVDEKMQGAYRTWTRELYTRVNPHTGLAIKDDPTVAFLQIQNEDSLLFWTQQNFPEPLKRALGRHFHVWCGKKYGSGGAALAAWNGAKDKRDDLTAGILGVTDISQLTKPAPPAQARRFADATQFLAEFQRDFYAKMGAHLRTLGCRQILNASNWRTANDATIKDTERWTYGSLQWDAENRYVVCDHTGAPEARWRVQAGNFYRPVSVLREPVQLPTIFRQHEGRPAMITETCWGLPNDYSAESAFLAAAYQSVSGMDGVCWFLAKTPEWGTNVQFPFWKLPGGLATPRHTMTVPQMAGAWPANALLYRRGDLREAGPVVRETRTPADLWARQTAQPVDHENPGVTDEFSRARLDDSTMSRAAFLVGPVRWQTGDAAKIEAAGLEKLISADTITAATGEVSLDHRRGLCRIAAPRAQGVCGFLREAGGRFELPDAVIESQNEYAVAQLVALDGEPLTQSRKVLAQVVTQAHLTGWETKSAEFKNHQGGKVQGRQIVQMGAPPWQIVTARVAFTLKNPHLRKVTRLDTNGYPAGSVEATRGAGALRFAFPPGALWVVLE